MAKTAPNRTPDPQDKAIESWFTPTEGGYTFRYPSPWLFGHWRSYLVSEAQKRGLMVFLRFRRQLLLRYLIAYVLVGALISVLASTQPAMQDLSTTTMGALVVAALAAMMAVMVVPHLYLLRKMEPILAQAKRTDSLGTFREQIFAVANLVPTGLLVTGGVGFFMAALSSVDSLAEAIAQGADPWRLVWPGAGLFISTLLTIYFIYVIMLKRRLKREADKQNALTRRR
jgi:hypothetical protein